VQAATAPGASSTTRECVADARCIVATEDRMVVVVVVVEAVVVVWKW